jgi:hypothetical protein
MPRHAGANQSGVKPHAKIHIDQSVDVDGEKTSDF